MLPRPPLSELELIEWIRRTNPETSHPVGIGDDSAVLRVSRQGRIVLTTDMLLAGVHFDERATPYRIGWKAAGRALSDIAAMGARPVAITLCTCFPPGAGTALARGILRGARALCQRLDTELIGGDVSAWSGPLALNVTAVGDAGQQKPITRAGARLGHAICVSGSLGGSILGRHLRFVPRIQLGLLLARRFSPSSMIDISDGLARDLHHILEESKVGAVLLEKAIPISRAARKLAKQTGRSPLSHALSDGEDYELLFTLSQPSMKQLLRSQAGVPVRCIGTILEKGFFLESPTGGRHSLAASGFEHLIS